MGDFIGSSVAYGLVHGEFEHIAEPDKQKLIALMSRISEQSYRRGFQHGCVMDSKQFDVSPIELRHEWPLGKSPYTDSAEVISSVERLFTEYGVLRSIGFREPSA
jgi:hypothetical protein